MPVIKLVTAPAGIVFRRYLSTHYCRSCAKRLKLRTLLTETRQDEIEAGLACFGAWWPRSGAVSLEFCEVGL